MTDDKPIVIRVEIPAEEIPDDDDSGIECEDDGCISDHDLRELKVKLNAMPGAVEFARETWYNDGAEGETVHLLAKFAEQLPALIRRLEKAEKRLDFAEVVGVQGMEDWDDVCARCNTSTDEPHDRADCLEQELSTSGYVTWSLEGMLDAAHVREDLVRKKIEELAECAKVDDTYEGLRERSIKLSGFVKEPVLMGDPQSPVSASTDLMVEAVSILKDIHDHGADESWKSRIASRVESWARRQEKLREQT